MYIRHVLVNYIRHHSELHVLDMYVSELHKASSELHKTYSELHKTYSELHKTYSECT